MVMFKNGVQYKYYTGQRTKKDIVEYAEQFMRDNADA